MFESIYLVHFALFVLKYKEVKASFICKIGTNAAYKLDISKQTMQNVPDKLTQTLWESVSKVPKPLTYPADGHFYLIFSCINKLNNPSKRDYVIARVTMYYNNTGYGKVDWLTKNTIKAPTNRLDTVFRPTNQIKFIDSNKNDKFQLAYNGNYIDGSFNIDSFSYSEEKMGPKIGFQKRQVALCFVVGRYGESRQLKTEFDYGNTYDFYRVFYK